jgi:predicted RNA-binding protein with RPS1 domain
MRTEWQNQKKSEEEIANLMKTNPEYLKLERDFTAMKNFPYRLLAQQGWIYYWEGNHKKGMTFPSDDPKLTPRICDYLRLGLMHSTTQTVFKDAIEEHLRALKRQQRKLEKLKVRETQKQKKALEKAASTKAKDADKDKKVEDQSKRRYPDCVKIGTTVEGVVESVANYGAFVYFIYELYELKGLIPVSETGRFSKKNIPQDSKSKSQNNRAEITECLFPGDKVKCVIIKIDAENRRITLSLRDQFFPQGEKPEVQHIEDYSEKLSEFKMEKIMSTHTGDNQYVSALQDDGSAARQELVSRMRAFLALSKGIVPSGKNRMGQRERRKLAKTLYGKSKLRIELEGEDEQVQDTKRSKTEKSKSVTIK